ncbi:unnamed protein product, partial [Mesorhabditis belari]|uniref:Right handed beta helix domain-containing protein n=1 Tax=Mesorhabditis belari TaxID=2138241 RepID=A0AAF3EHY2_9BILA
MLILISLCLSTLWLSFSNAQAIYKNATTTKFVPKANYSYGYNENYATTVRLLIPPTPKAYYFDSRANPHIISYNLTIMKGDSCTIREGVIMRFKNNTGIIVYGDPDDPVILEADDETWHGLLIFAHDLVSLRNVEIKQSSYGVTVRNSTKIPLFDGVYATKNSNGFSFEELFTFGAPPYVIKNCHASESKISGFRIQNTFADFIFENCSSNLNEGAGFTIYNAVNKIALKSTTIASNYGHGILYTKDVGAFGFSNGSSVLTIVDSEITKNLYGIIISKVLQDQSHHKSVDRLTVRIISTTFSNHIMPAVSFDKCFPCFLKITTSTFRENTAGILISKDNSGIGLDIQNSFFVSNQARVFIENNTFANNTEFNAAPKSSLIDLIYTDSSAVRNFAITDNIFNGNTAKYIARVFEKDEEMSVSVSRKRHEIAKNHFNNNTGWSLIFASVALTDIFGNTFQSKEMKCDITTNEPRKPNWLDLQKNEFIAFPDNLISLRAAMSLLVKFESKSARVKGISFHPTRP